VRKLTQLMVLLIVATLSLGIFAQSGLKGSAQEANTGLSLDLERTKAGFTAVIFFDASGLDPVAAGSFVLNYPANSFDVNLADCVVDLPSTHTGQCAVRESENEVRVIFFSGSNAELASGVVGSVDFIRKSSGISAKGLRSAAQSRVNNNITISSISLGGVDGGTVY